MSACCCNFLSRLKRGLRERGKADAEPGGFEKVSEEAKTRRLEMIDLSGMRNCSDESIQLEYLYQFHAVKSRQALKAIFPRGGEERRKSYRKWAGERIQMLIFWGRGRGRGRYCN